MSCSTPFSCCSLAHRCLRRRKYRHDDHESHLSPPPSPKTTPSRLFHPVSVPPDADWWPFLSSVRASLSQARSSSISAYFVTLFRAHGRLVERPPCHFFSFFLFFLFPILSRTSHTHASTPAEAKQTGRCMYVHKQCHFLSPYFINVRRGKKVRRHCCGNRSLK